MAGILEGLKVLEMGHVVAVPAASATLGDWGADVLKVEPLTGDMGRGFLRIMGIDVTVGNTQVSWYVQLMNRNKRSIALNLKTEEGRAILYELIKEYDIFVSNYQVSSLKRLGADYDTLGRVNPRLIFAVLSGYGTRGPDKEERGFDHTAAWARSGIQYLIGEPGSPPPPERGGLMDRATAAQLLAGVLAALWHREKTGEGQAMEISLYQTAVWLSCEDIQSALMGTPLPKWDRTCADNPLFNSYCAGDGRWFQLAMLQSDEGWPGLCRAIGRPELERDPRFADMDSRSRNCVELISILDGVFAQKTRPEWEKLFRENGCIFGLVQSTTEVTQDPQAQINEFFGTLKHPEAGDMPLVNTPLRFLQNPAALRAPAPEVGQHTEEVLLDMGHTWEEIGTLKEKGVIL